MARSPLPRISLAATCDVSGNVSITNQLAAPASFWALIYVAIEASAGSPAWAVQLGSTATAAPLVFGIGQQVMLGPFLLLPQEQASIIVAGAASAAVITGQALGWQADSPEDLLGLTPITTALVTQPVGGRVQVGFPAISAGLPLPAGTYTFDVPNQNGAVGCIVYYNFRTPGGTGTLTVYQNDPRIPAARTAILASPTGTPETGTLRIYPGLTPVANAIASDLSGFSPEIEFVATQPITVLQVDVDMVT